MSKRIFAKEQIEILLQNPSIAGCSEKSISYHKDFKILAARKYQEGLTASEIFKQANFNIDMIGCDTPKECLRRWRKTFGNKGAAGFENGRENNNPRGRPRKIVDINDEEKMKRLEAEIAYLREENRFLTKLRKKSLN